MSTQRQDKAKIRIPLRAIFIVPFVAQIILITGLVGYLSFRNGQRAVNDVTRQLLSETSARIEEHLRIFLDTPHRINRINAAAIRQGLLDVHDPTDMEHYYWEQAQIYHSVTSIYFGNTKGGLVGSGREGAGGTLYVTGTDGFTQGMFYKYATDSAGNHTDLLAAVPNFDARTRPWYTGAIEKGDATWSNIYILFTGQDMAIAASCPVYDNQQVLGVLSIDLFVSHLGSFMQQLEIGKSGQSFVIERSGLMVTSSTDEQPFTNPEGETPPRRLFAHESGIPSIRHAALFLTEQFDSFYNITDDQQLEFEIEGQRHFLQVSPFQDQYGIDWLIVVVVPESDFMAQINANNRTTALIIGAALIVAVLVGVITAQGVTRPILRLSASTQALVHGKWQQAAVAGWIREIGDLAQSFDRMAGQLKQLLESLSTEISERKQAETQVRRHNQELTALHDTSLDLITLRELPKLLRAIVERAIDLLKAQVGSVWLYRPDSDDLELVIQIGSDPDFSGTILQRGEGMAGKVLENGQAKVIANYSQWEGRSEQFSAGQYASSCAVPIRWGDRIVGVLSLSDEHQRQFSPTDIALLERFAPLAAAALENARLLRDLQQQMKQLKNTQSQLVQSAKLAAVGELAAGVAHELNNPLTSVLGFAEILADTLDLEASDQEAMDAIISEARRARNIVRNLLDFARQTRPQRRLTDVNEIVQQTLRVIRYHLEKSGIQIEEDYSTEIGMIFLDEGQIKQVLLNLISNAAHATPEGGTLRLGTAQIGSEVAMSISDTGEGIPPENLDHIFDPFYSTKSSGTGLGLSISLGIVQSHQGRITVESEVGKGSTFTVWLPVRTQE